jgi:predicted HAD superfamily Cof-like phosphohydrolase
MTERTNFQAVGDFHERFGLDNVNTTAPAPHKIVEELWTFRLKFLREELDELERAYQAGDLPNIADALIDLVYVALGTAHLHGLPWQELFDEVQRVNMMKVRATRAEDSTRKSTFDVIKPDGWTPPNIEAVLARHGWTK